MKAETKYLTRRHLEAYSEIELGKLLNKKAWMCFFPFKDKGIDMIAMKGKKIELYQLKARNEERNCKGVYWFPSRDNSKKLSKWASAKRIFFIFCASQPNQMDFHFFKVPLSIVRKYFKIKNKTSKKTTDFEIKKIINNKYKIMPSRINIDINKYRLK